MKIALCFAGQPRNVHHGHSYFKPNLLDINECDVFVHTWYSEEQIGKAYYGWDGFQLSNAVPETVLNDIEQLYQPKVLKVEPQKQFEDAPLTRWQTLTYPYTPMFNLTSQFYSVNQVFGTLRQYEQENNVQYDVVVRARLDWALKTPLRLEQFDMNYVWHPEGCPYPDGIVDQFAFSKRDNMDVYCQLGTYENIERLYNARTRFTGESMIKNWLMMNNISTSPVSGLMYPHAFDIIRTS